MTKPLFEGFDAVTPKQWKQKIQFELNGADYNETLVWKSPEGILVKPFYTSEDAATTASIVKDGTWKIGQPIYAGLASAANKKALDALERGAESFVFTIASDEISVEKLLEGLSLSTVEIHFYLPFYSIDFVKKLDSFLQKQPEKNCFLQVDPIGNLTKTGNWFKNKEHDLTYAKQTTQFSAFNNIYFVDASTYQNAGATITQQLAYALAHAHEYLALADSPSAKKILFKLAIGGNYFFEIAKIRALRLLWATLAPEYGFAEDCHILATPTKRNKTLYDYNVNMLRTTSECMSAILGGADTVCNLPYDAIYHKDNEFGERVARNQLLLLKHESYFDVVENPADGAYYVEALTHQLAENALEIFKQVEAGGGFINQLKEHTIQRKIKESANAEQALFDTQKQVLVGTNKYPNAADKMKDNLQLYPFVKAKPIKTIIEPIIEKRIAESAEEERLQIEKND